MGREYKKRVKQLLGKPAVLGRDVISVAATGVQSVASHTKLARDHIDTWRMNKKAELRSFTIEVDKAVGSGVLEATLLSDQDGVLASGAVTQKGRTWTWSPDSLNRQVLSSGTILEAAYRVTNLLPSWNNVQGRIAVDYLDEQ